MATQNAKSSKVLRAGAYFAMIAAPVWGVNKLADSGRMDLLQARVPSVVEGAGFRHDLSGPVKSGREACPGSHPDGGYVTVFNQNSETPDGRIRKLACFDNKGNGILLDDTRKGQTECEPTDDVCALPQKSCSEVEGKEYCTASVVTCTGFPSNSCTYKF